MHGRVYRHVTSRPIMAATCCYTCSICRQSKPHTAFHRDRSRFNGLNSRCAVCMNAKYWTISKPCYTGGCDGIAKGGAAYCHHCRRERTRLGLVKHKMDGSLRQLCKTEGCTNYESTKGLCDNCHESTLYHAKRKAYFADGSYTCITKGCTKFAFSGRWCNTCIRCIRRGKPCADGSLYKRVGHGKYIKIKDAD